MSRPIKFRAWVPQFESYGEVLDIHFSEEGLPEIIEVFVNGSNHHLGDFEVVLEQDTGLKDKNGKMIWEGDIVDYAGDCTCVIQYEDEGARFIHRDILDDFPFGFNGLGEYNGKLFEVIGNIHETPELLGGKE